MEKNLWACIRKAINTFDDGEIVSRQQLLEKINAIYPKKVSGGSFDIYRLLLTRIKILKWHSKGYYIKLQKFPESLSTSKASKLENHYRWGKPDWKDWFSENLEDRIKML